jgi:integrative and conjugative element protein (TIGR02256 family)
MKPNVVTELHAAVMDGASQVTPLCVDALDETDNALAETLQASTLVVDASTTLEYPRRASGLEGVGRHLSVFLTPSGNAAVLLAEDTERTCRLRTLEAQYYRALIRTDWGARHLDGHLGTFWSGAGCRDISNIMPYSRVLAHAATLAEQVQKAANQPEARIRVWSRDPVAGSVTAHSVSVHTERRLEMEGLDLFIDQGVEQALREQRAQHAPQETGGVLVGYYDFNEQAVVVVDALPAPPDSESTQASFVRGAEGLREAIEEIARQTGRVVQYIGEWHSHPPGHSATPSQDDVYQLVYLSMGMAEDGLPAVSLIMGEGDMQILTGTVAR